MQRAKKRGRSLLIGGTAAVLVVATALAATFFAGAGQDPAAGHPGSLAAAVTGTTDRLTGADTSGTPEPASTPGRQEPSRQQWADLLPQLKAAAQQNSSDVTARRKLALVYYNLGTFSEAAQVYRDLLSAREDAVLRDRLGNTLRDMGDSAAAESAYRRAIVDDPTLAPPYLNLAELLWRQGNNDGALSVLNDGLAAVPETARPVLEKARQLLKGQVEESTT